MWHDEQNSALCSVWNGFMKVSRWGFGASRSSRSCTLRSRGCSLAARSCSGGYSMVKSPWPMVLPTCTIEWHDVQPSPACASGVSICSTIGVSKRPLKNTAWSWQPAHHFDGRVPTTSCMYSMDRRYHWLLNDEKWWADAFHCS